MDQPEITLEMRASARSNPDSWLYVIDPEFSRHEDVPPWGVVGAYPVDERGQIGERFRANRDYRPSPTALRMPVPANRLEKVLQLIHTRYRPQADLLPELHDATLLIFARSSNDAGITGFPARDGTVMVPACTSATHVPPAWPAWREVRGHEVAALLGGHPLVVNPESPITAVVPAAHLAATRPSPRRARREKPATHRA
ncbi:type VII secretion system-associated protein [Actinokineospora cianjurensis]|uniref:Type III secretion system (T3SS) SseB-like protein n=1 Tax=Actinokineospora cianjurensis TaxID=585224 RepID=A0A421B895_9PSEU|nr:type VII secretion system-associated protein [Actinokineospora cianjurensis]RLK60443.1 type III secretion system (T3SS) SseB-like protein [Actinokineospora cianjurensis]